MVDDADNEDRFDFRIPDIFENETDLDLPTNNAVEEPRSISMLHQVSGHGQSNITLFFGRADAKSCSNTQVASSSQQTNVAASNAADDAAPLPHLAAIERVRATKQKLEPGPRGRQKAARITKETKVPLQQRLKEFPNEFLKISNGELFCTACKDKMPNLKEQMKRHFETSKHIENKAIFVKSGLSNADMRSDIYEYFEHNKDQHGVSHYSSLSCLCLHVC